ncbi:MAG: response regulator [Alphaproteobacteria bacterium]|nr:response regulator [Alphaproteobacteria bacterium]
MKCVTSTQTILIVDDSDDDYDATVRALTKHTNLKNPIRRCKGGRETLDYLHGRGRYSDAASAPRPGIILLDLNMPGVDGRRVLAELKKDPNLKKIPTIVMTNSDDEHDIDVCYEIGANTFVQKPLEWDSFFEAMKRLKEYWFEIAVLPKE